MILRKLLLYLFLFTQLSNCLNVQYPYFRCRQNLRIQTCKLDDSNIHSNLQLSSKISEISKKAIKFAKILVIVPALILSTMQVTIGDDELARFAADGNKVGVDGQCFLRKCALETSSCANDPSCLKGLSCLARCKGASLCSTGCFAKYGSHSLDNILSCSVEKNDCVHVPGKESTGWVADKLEDLPTMPLKQFQYTELKGKWYKVMGLDSRYDCFDCQRNTFQIKGKNVLGMEALFRIPRPNPPGYLQNKIVEEMKVTDSKVDRISHFQSKGEMFGLTFWENWYVLGESKPPKLLGVSEVRASEQSPDLKLIYYTGHTLQGNYKGAFILSRTKEMTPGLLQSAAEVIKSAGMNPNDFCIIKNQCFDKDFDVSVDASKVLSKGEEESTPFWLLGQKFFRVTEKVAEELVDWFEDPAILSDWLIKQQERMVFTQPLEVSPFASLPESGP